MHAHPSRFHSRTVNGSASASVPHSEYFLDEGNHRSITTSSRPYHLHLLSSMARSSYHAASEIARASVWLPNIPRPFRSSITTTRLSRTSRVVTLGR